MNNKGFTLIEALIASSIVVFLITTFVPLALFIHKERHILNNRYLFAAKLHDELQTVLWNNRKLPITFTEPINSTYIIFSFKNEKEFIEGCVQWENVKDNEETICLYGYPSE